MHLSCSYGAAAGMGAIHNSGNRLKDVGSFWVLEYGCPKETLNTAGWEGRLISLAKKLSFCNL